MLLANIRSTSAIRTSPIDLLRASPRAPTISARSVARWLPEKGSCQIWKSIAEIWLSRRMRFNQRARILLTLSKIELHSKSNWWRRRGRTLGTRLWKSVSILTTFRGILLSRLTRSIQCWQTTQLHKFMLGSSSSLRCPWFCSRLSELKLSAIVTRLNAKILAKTSSNALSTPTANLLFKDRFAKVEFCIWLSQWYTVWE